MDINFEEERNLTTCETLIMKAIWDVGEDVSAIELREILKNRFGKDYSRTTLATFLLKLSDKGFVKSYLIGRNSYIRATKSEEEYKRKQLKDQTDFWYSGKVSNMVCELFESQKITKEELNKIRSILDELGELAD